MAKTNLSYMTPTLPSTAVLSSLLYPPPAPPMPSFISMEMEAAVQPKLKVNPNRVVVCAQCGTLNGKESCCILFSVFVDKTDMKTQDNHVVKGTCIEFGSSA